MKMRKAIFLLVVLLVLTSVLSTLTACKGDEEELEVVMISIQDESFGSVYVAGSTLDLSNAKLTLRYIDGSVKVIPITMDMISDFDTGTTGDKKLKVTYQGITATYNYTVIAASKIETPVKFRPEKYKDEYGNTYVDVYISGVADESEGVYAFSFDMAIVGGLVGTVDTTTLAHGFEKAYSRDAGYMRFLAYALDGYTKYSADGRVCRVMILDLKDTASVTIQNIKVQNGAKDVTSTKSTLSLSTK